MVDPTLVMGTAPPPAAWLVIRSGSQAGRDCRLGEQTTVGRDGMSCDFVLDDDSVSAQHARIKSERGQFVLYDLASTNGTRLNGRRVQRSNLVDGDEIVIGVVKLVFKEVKPSSE
jgi:pSer/pThr/pTyr-binding forkhead associated (FHA) protein